MALDFRPPFMDDLMPALSGGVSAGGRVKAGRVVSTAGSQLVILLDRNITVTDAVQMGNLVTVHTAEATVYGTIEGLSTPMPLQLVDGRELKVAQLGLLGEVQHGADGVSGFFHRGVSRLPSLDAAVYLANEDDTAVVYALNNRRFRSARCFRIPGFQHGSALTTC